MDCTLKLESVIILLYWRDIPSLKLEPKHKHLTFVMRSHESLQIVASESSLKQGQCLSYVHSIFIDCHVMTSHVKGIFIAKLAYCRAKCANHIHHYHSIGYHQAQVTRHFNFNHALAQTQSITTTNYSGYPLFVSSWEKESRHTHVLSISWTRYFIVNLDLCLILIS